MGDKSIAIPQCLNEIVRAFYTLPEGASPRGYMGENDVMLIYAEEGNDYYFYTNGEWIKG